MRNSTKFALVAALIPTLLSAAGGDSGFVRAARADAEREAVQQTSTSAEMYMWSDKIIYSAGDPLTLKWTSNPNDDLYFYTFFLYLINNQTGVKTYYPDNTAAASDIFGRNASEGFQISRLPTASKATLIGAGGSVSSSALTLPSELGMYTLVFEVRDYTATRVIKRLYQKFVIVEQTEDLTGQISANRTLVNTRAYRLRGNVFVTGNSTLTIPPGTIIVGEPGTFPNTALLAVTRGSRLIAIGTQARPIIFTSSRPVGQRNPGDWGGLVLLGAGQVNLSGTGTENAVAEGLPAELGAYGGTDLASSCGTLKYVRVEYGGERITSTNELNGIALHGCGSGTTLSYVQAHFGADDAFEWFGGSAQNDHLVASYGLDDQLDWTFGFNGTIHHAVGIQGTQPDVDPRGIEADGNEFRNGATPFSEPTIYNLTLVGSPTLSVDGSGIVFRRGTRFSLYNSVVTGFARNGFDVRDATSQGFLTDGTARLNGLVLWGNNHNTQGTNNLEGQVAAAARTFINERGNVLFVNPMLTRATQSSDPDFRPLPGSPLLNPGYLQPPDTAPFSQPGSACLGAICQDNWLEEWTNFLRDADLV